VRTVIVQVTTEELQSIECLMEPHERIAVMDGSFYPLILNLEKQPGHEERRILFMPKEKPE
jgi:hypothetical protein